MNDESPLEPDEEPPLLPGMAETEVTMNALQCDVYTAINTAYASVQKGDLEGFVYVVAAHLWWRGYTLPGLSDIWMDDEVSS